MALPDSGISRVQKERTASSRQPSLSLAGDWVMRWQSSTRKLPIKDRRARLCPAGMGAWPRGREGGWRSPAPRPAEPAAGRGALVVQISGQH